MRIRIKLAGVVWFLGISLLPALADPALDALVAAYPDQLAGYEGETLIWKDGTRMTVSDGRSGKSFDQMLDDASVRDQFVIPYPLGEIKAPGLNEDPGRIRNDAFFLKMYGDCRKGEVTKRMKAVAWLPSRHGGTVMATTVNGVADRLAEVSRDLDKLPASMTQYLVPSAGTYNCRPIAETHRLSVHAFGAAIDLATKFGDYWVWSRKKSGEPAWKNRFPQAVADVFEAHGFIWGAKWYHFDTFHFEYRPEIIALAKQGWPKN
jgi:D-alanyl-D-alanine carboxypeptidase